MAIYEFVLASNRAYANPLITKSGRNALKGTVFESEEKLDYDTTYYWKVQAISASSESEWPEGVFTTESAPPEKPTPAPTPPPAPEPETPAYIWVIIGIGAVLIVAMIILIVRTRRTV